MTRSRYYFAAIAVLLLATWLRFHNIEAQSFWHDEGNSARLSERTLRLIIEGTASDIHPPFYYILLHAWRGLVGASEFTLRGVSAFAGIAVVALTFTLARFTFGLKQARLAGLLAAILVAVNPPMLWYSQETRMYTLLSLWILLATCVLLWAQRDGWTWRLIVGYVLLLSAGLYTHYFFPITFAIHGMVVLFSLKGEEQFSLRPLLRWVGMVIASFVLFAPWLPFVLNGLGGNRGVAQPLTGFAVDVAGWLWFGAVNQSASTVGSLWLLVLVSSVVFRPKKALPLITILILPLAALVIIGATDATFYKFLLLIVPALALLLAHAIVKATERMREISRLGAALFYVGLAGVVLLSLSSWLQVNDVYARDDYRGIAELISAENNPSAAVILNAPNQWEVFTWYHREGATVYPIETKSEAQTVADLEEITSEHMRLYTLYWGDTLQDPEHWVEEWLDDNTFKVSEEWRGQVRFVQYSVPSGDSATMQVPVDLTFGDDLLLEGFTLTNRDVSAGDILELSLFWQLTAETDGRFKLFTHLLDDAGVLVAQRDIEPVPYTFDWTPDETRILTPGMLIPTETPPGSYTLRIGMYDVLDPSARLLLSDGSDGFDVAMITVSER